jgi:hypothetical protein
MEWSIVAKDAPIESSDPGEEKGGKIAVRR